MDHNLAGVGLDVFAQEPIQPDSSMQHLTNVVLTPHMGGATRDIWVESMSAAWGNVRQVEAGETALSLIG